MISDERLQNALRALTHAVVLTRKMAYDGVEQKEIAEALDVIEYLPRLLAHRLDQSTTFRRCLEDLARRWPDFGTALEFFDGPPPEHW